MKPGDATRLLTVLENPEPCMHRAATRVTCANRLWAHTNRFEHKYETYKRMQSDTTSRYAPCGADARRYVANESVENGGPLAAKKALIKVHCVDR